ncbi:NCS1 family nucleobase:cation symporter-1 [Clostridium lacusfryxellense]|uniref:NCS1 family nucleobase:cation symporter-1 n=1 Tax=Clostridium lacusfryxellense TaxID=205328 RepID=UPI001C0BBF5B|nr:NCS1 family nucleobase:cation symporter-1 [Clostridium lacusfryxellense]MBU3113233.1 NCS1 family nucleobase:cation symporter-1 [Clostridium lacusfryxellense]
MSKTIKTQREINGLFELTEGAIIKVKDSPYYNDDLAATKIKERTWGAYNIAALWIGMCVCIPTYMMASGIMAAGLTWWQALLNITLGNLIVLIPMQLNSHAGTKYGIPYPVFARLSFGIKGSNIAAMARGIVGAGWFGIQCWIGGEAINTVFSTLSPAWSNWSLGIWVSFFAFWAVNVAIAYKGLEAIKFMESWGAPILGIISLALMYWALTSVLGAGKSVGDIFNMPVANKAPHFWKTFMVSLTANIAFWSTLSLNIPDFSRYAKSQKDQAKGQILGLPLTMLAFSFVGVFVTGATKVLYGEFIWDPVQVIQKIDTPVAAILGAVGIIIATLTTNIAANAVATSNDISNLSPKKISFKNATLITGALGVAIMPWKLMSSASAYIFGWLGTYGLLLGPLAGIFIADYYIHRKKVIDVYSLFAGSEGRYWYKNGYNLNAVYAWILAVILPVIGKFVPSLSFLADNGWIIGFLLGMLIYTLLMKNDKVSILSEEENEKITEVKIENTKVS